MSTSLTHCIIGGGAAGFFGAITCAQYFPDDRVILLEKSRQVLSKVRISGGGRCNVTHACFDPALLIKNYPRGHQELRSLFSRFQPRETIQWFESRGVPLKAEEDGRIFPVSDSSETIIQCLLEEARKQKIEIWLGKGVQDILPLPQKGFSLELSDDERLACDRLLMATGSAPKTYPLLEKLGHSVVPLVPSLFTFNLPTSPFLDLAGISLPLAKVYLPALKMEQVGPLLLTHWGLSGPAILKLSAWAARELHELNYQTKVEVNWVPSFSEGELRQLLLKMKEKEAARQIESEPLFGLSKQLWKRILVLAQLPALLRWSSLSHSQLQALLCSLTKTELFMEGKTTYKQEFVTCGGVDLREVNFKTMESRLCPGLFLAGEILNIDGVTGGFNFQNAWSTGWVAGQAMGERRSRI